MQWRKKIRLDAQRYIGQNAYSIAICTFNREEIFTAVEIIDQMIKLMNESLNDDFRIYVVTFMPDHLHLLLEGKSDSSDLIKGIKLFKQKSGYWYKQCADRRLWQKRFFDRILRRSEDLESVAWYIINNPVRDNLVDDPFEYPFTKSFVWNDLREIEPGL